MANNSQSDSFQAKLSGHYFEIHESASQFLTRDADGNDLFLVLVRAVPKDPAGDAGSTSESFSPQDSPLPKFDKRLVSAFTAAKADGDICDKQHCAGPFNPFHPGKPKGKPKGKPRVPKNQFMASAVEGGAATSGSTDIQEEIEFITHVARIAYSSIYLDSPDPSGGDAASNPETKKQ